MEGCIKTIITNPMPVDCRYQWIPTHGMVVGAGRSTTINCCVWTATNEVGRKMLAMDIQLGRVRLVYKVRDASGNWIEIETANGVPKVPPAPGKVEQLVPPAKQAKPAEPKPEPRKEYVAPQSRNKDTTTTSTFDEVFVSKPVEEMKPKSENLFGMFAGESDEIRKPETVHLFEAISDSLNVPVAPAPAPAPAPDPGPPPITGGPDPVENMPITGGPDPVEDQDGKEEEGRGKGRRRGRGRGRGQGSRTVTL